MDADLKNGDAYFMLYEDRYRRIHQQGIENWVWDPGEIPRIITKVNDFLDYARCQPLKTSIIEYGCGEGHLAKYLLEVGYKHLGVDISESAISNAKVMTGTKGHNSFLTTDITDLHQINDCSFDLAIDNQCLQMLVTDKHRSRYLSEIKRILKSNGKVFFREIIQQEEFKAKISSFEEFVNTCHGDYSRLYDYPAYVDGEMHLIKLPKIPARINNEEGYKRELKEAGFTVAYFKDEGNQCIIYACLK
jgi:SAM-dependent methyltransferase